MLEDESFNTFLDENMRSHDLKYRKVELGCETMEKEGYKGELLHEIFNLINQHEFSLIDSHYELIEIILATAMSW